MSLRALFFSAIVLATPGFVAAATDDYRVTGAEGDVAIVPAGADSASPAAVGLPLNSGDRIVTGGSGRVEIAGENGTMFRLSENSAFLIEEPSTAWSSFRLQVGRLLAKFAPSTGRPYRVNTPVAVAAVRGTELILEVSESGELQGGVVEGEVAFEPVSTPGAPNAEGWKPETVTRDGGITIAPHSRPNRMAAIPPPLVSALAEFPRIRERVPQVRERWKSIKPAERQNIRREALRERVRWNVPPANLHHVPPPTHKKPEVAPVKREPPRPQPAQPAKPPRRPAGL